MGGADFGLGPFNVGVVVLGWWDLLSQPFLMLSKMHPIVLAKHKNKDKQ